MSEQMMMMAPASFSKDTLSLPLQLRKTLINAVDNDEKWCLFFKTLKVVKVVLVD